MQTSTVTRGYQSNVVPFDNHRRRLHFEHSSGGETHPRGVVVRLPLPTASRALERRTDAPAPEDEEFRQRMIVNAVAATVLTFLMVAGYWIGTTLAGVV
jgi:hypothetical protein